MTANLWILALGFGLVAALRPVPHQTSEESLRGALNALTRKQRSLNANSQAYYAGLGKLQRQQVAGDEIDDNDEALAFMPSEGAGQLETIGDGYQHLNNKQYNQALMDYLQYSADQGEPSQSMFRERWRTNTRDDGSKRAGTFDKISDKQLASLLLEDIENQLPEEQDQLNDDEYQRILEIIYDKYKNQPDNGYGGSNGMSRDDQLLLSELLGDEEREDDQDPRLARVHSADRRNVNARYPLFNRDYNYMTKRFPVSKRSAKSVNKKRQVTDPKVAQDLGGLFGTQSTDTVNHTHEHDHDHEHHEHEHDHEHDHEHNHDHEHEHDHAKAGIQLSAGPTSASKPKNTKESLAKASHPAKERPIEVKKKSVDWSQYFGIDRRKKKAVYMARPGTQDQDNEYLLQKYYEIMAENLNPAARDGAEKRDKLQQMDSKLKNMKNMMIEEAVQVGSKNDMDSQEVKDEIMSRLAAAYSLEKLRRALNELSSNAQREAAQKAAEAQNNLTVNHPGGAAEGKSEDKRNRNVIDDYQDIEEENCPGLDIIERRCKATEALIGDFRQVLHIPCVMFHICNTCEQEDCLERFVSEAEKICDEEEVDDSLWSKRHCLQAAMVLPRYPPPISSSAICAADSCLARFQNRNRHRYAYGSGSYGVPRHRAYDLASSKR